MLKAAEHIYLSNDYYYCGQYVIRQNINVVKQSKAWINHEIGLLNSRKKNAFVGNVPKIEEKKNQ